MILEVLAQFDPWAEFRGTVRALECVLELVLSITRARNITWSAAHSLLWVISIMAKQCAHKCYVYKKNIKAKYKKIYTFDARSFVPQAKNYEFPQSRQKRPTCAEFINVLWCGLLFIVARDDASLFTWAIFAALCRKIKSTIFASRKYTASRTHFMHLMPNVNVPKL